MKFIFRRPASGMTLISSHLQCTTVDTTTVIIRVQTFHAPRNWRSAGRSNSVSATFRARVTRQCAAFDIRCRTRDRTNADGQIVSDVGLEGPRHYCPCAQGGIRAHFRFPVIIISTRSTGDPPLRTRYLWSRIWTYSHVAKKKKEKKKDAFDVYHWRFFFFFLCEWLLMGWGNVNESSGKKKKSINIYTEKPIDVNVEAK